MEEREQFSEADVDAEDYLDNDEDEDQAENGKHDKDDDEFKVDDVLRLGGTKVSVHCLM